MARCSRSRVTIFLLTMLHILACSYLIYLYNTIDSRRQYTPKIDALDVSLYKPRDEGPLKVSFIEKVDPIKMEDTHTLTKEDLLTIDKVMKERREKVQQACREDPNLSIKSKISQSRLYVNDKLKVLYCFTPKVASTTWTTILMALDRGINATQIMTSEMAFKKRSKNTNVALYLWKDWKKSLRKLSLYPPRERDNILKKYFKMFFVREPFDRLYSAWKNKLNVSTPGYYTEKYGRDILRKYRKNAKVTDIKHGVGVTFEEFTRYILDINPGRTDPHWQTIQSTCAPCFINYDIIGNMYDLDRESQYILSKLGYNDVAMPHLNSMKSAKMDVTKKLKTLPTIPEANMNRIQEMYHVDYILSEAIGFKKYPYT
ncbi:unnamed protein product [Owenia fusiformis]|uniref:Carbohydrate sulfotransferase n=1 Tax=Owenia fusiformis TaxID=6347 RepID=A0A8J1TK60_OWEFU|nr:unnamed protein product [Owenia fusiformis]